MAPPLFSPPVFKHGTRSSSCNQTDPHNSAEVLSGGNGEEGCKRRHLTPAAGLFCGAQKVWLRVGVEVAVASVDRWEGISSSLNSCPSHLISLSTFFTVDLQHICAGPFFQTDCHWFKEPNVHLLTIARVPRLKEATTVWRVRGGQQCCGVTPSFTAQTLSCTSQKRQQGAPDFVLSLI